MPSRSGGRPRALCTPSWLNITHSTMHAVFLILSAMNALAPVLFSDSAYHSLLDDLQVCILAILATRMHLHLWYIAGTCTTLTPWASCGFRCPKCHLETVRCDVLSCGLFGAVRGVRFGWRADWSEWVGWVLGA